MHSKGNQYLNLVELIYQQKQCQQFFFFLILVRAYFVKGNQRGENERRVIE